MKITGILACLLLLTAASVRADSVSFRDHYFNFKSMAPEARESSLKRGAHTADWDPNTWTFSAVNEGPSWFLSQIDPSQRPAKPVAVAKTAKAPKTSRPASVLPFVRPDETIDYKLSVLKPKEGMDYKLKVVPGQSADTLR